MQASEIPVTYHLKVPSDLKAAPVIAVVDPPTMATNMMTTIKKFVAQWTANRDSSEAAPVITVDPQTTATESPRDETAVSEELRVPPYTRVDPQTTQAAAFTTTIPETQPSFDVILQGATVGSRKNLENVALDLKPRFALRPEDVHPDIGDYHTSIIGSQVDNMTNMYNVGAGANSPAPSSPMRTTPRRVNIRIENSDVGNMDNVRNSGNSTVAQAGFGKPPGKIFSRWR